MSRASQSRQRYRRARSTRVRRIVTEAHDTIARDEVEWDPPYGDTRCPVRDADGVWRQRDALRYRPQDDDEM